MSSRRLSPHPDVRVARGCFLAATSAVLSVTAHAAADGALPNLSLALVIAGLTGWVSTARIDRSRATHSGGLVGVFVTLAVAQLVIHWSLTLLGHQHEAQPDMGGWAMVAAHACATVAMAALITGAERGLLAVVAGLRRMLPVVMLPGPARAVTVGRPVMPAVPTSYVDVLLRRVNTRRGPPRCF